MAPPIPAPNSQAVNTAGGVPSFITVWYNFFNSLFAGVTDGSNAAVGNIGEYRSSFVVLGSGLALTNLTDKEITTLTLPAGDWQVTGEGFVQPAGGASIANVAGAINTVVSTTPATPADGLDSGRIGGLGANALITIGGLSTRANITVNTTYRLIIQAGFTGGTCTGYGALRARRMR